MARASPRTVHEYSDTFKLAVVRFSQEPGIQVKTVAAALAIHPFMHCRSGSRDHGAACVACRPLGGWRCAGSCRSRAHIADDRQGAE